MIKNKPLYYKIFTAVHNILFPINKKPAKINGHLTSEISKAVYEVLEMDILFDCNKE